MIFKELQLEMPYGLPSGTQVTDAWIGEGPIVLIGGTSKDGEVFRTRLDLQKEMFIDQMPSDRDIEEAPAVSGAVRMATEILLR